MASGADARPPGADARPARSPGALPPARWRPLLAPWGGGVLGLLATTAGLLVLRSRLDKAHVALVYLLAVLGGSAAGGRTLGVALSVAAFLIFDFLFLPPYYTLVIADPFDWLVLFAFLVTGIIAAQLLYRAQREAEVARRRAAEVDRLAALGAETLSAGRADAALAAIARVIRETVGVEACEVYVLAGDGPATGTHLRADAARRPDAALPIRLAARASAELEDDARDDARGDPTGNGRAAVPARDAPVLVHWVARHGRAAAEGADGTSRMLGRGGAAAVAGSAAPSLIDGANEAAGDASHDLRAFLLPLTVHERTVGVLRLSDARAVRLDPTRQRYLDALAYYAALGVERLRLAAEAERAEALREADRLKDSLLATVSHDLRTPLTTIRGLAHDIAASGADSGDERALVIEDEVDRLNRFVADLLDLSRLSAGGVPLHLEVNAAEDLMGAALQRVSGVTAGREIRASLDPAEPILLGRFDLGHSIRILGNLLENACKYAPPGTPVDFTVRREGGPAGDVLAFRLADRGPGIPPAERTRIFAPFYRPPGAPADVGSAGLGLAIARGLAEAQGGGLTYEPRPGGGSVFTLRLPAADLEAFDEPPSPPGPMA